MKTRVVGISLLTLALAGGAAAVAFAQSSRSASMPPAAVNTGRDIGDGDGEEDDDGPETDQVVTIDQVPAGVRDTIVAHLGGGTALKIEIGDEDGRQVYEVKPSSGPEFKVSPTGEYLGTDTDDEHDDGDGDGEHNDD